MDQTLADAVTAPRSYAYEERTLPFVLDDMANRLGNRPFILGDREVAVAELRDLAAELGGGLTRLGVQRGDRVLTMLPNGIDAVVAPFGSAWIGAVHVPINTGYRGRMLEYVINDAEARVLIIDAEYLESLREVLAALAACPQVVVVGDPPEDLPFEWLPWASLRGEHALRANVGPGDLQAIMYTSGTTGPSKGVMVPYHCAYQYASPGANMRIHGDVVYVTLPLFHIGGLWAGVYSALLIEGQVVLKRKFSVTEFWDDVDRFGVTETILLGVMAEFLWKQPARQDDADHSLLRATVTPAPKNATAFAERFGLRISQGWGLTEVGCVTAAPPHDQPAQDPATCGRLREDLFEMILADDNDRPVPDGTVGQALVRPKVPFVTMLGYWRKPEATVETWRNLWLHTGDALVRRDDGYYQFVDRQKDCIRRRGENISSLEVELEVLTHPDVRECAAVAVHDPHAEDEVKIVIAAREGASVDPAELHAYLSPRMPTFMLPRFIEVVTELPKTPTQKIKKDVLRKAGVTQGVWDSQQRGSSRVS